jgi:hypothetical protein
LPKSRDESGLKRHLVEQGHDVNVFWSDKHHNHQEQNMETRMNHNILEHGTTAKHLVCWRSLIAGLLLSMLVFSGLLGLGFALGGIGLADGTTALNASIFTGVWFIVSAALSLFVGGYFSVRMGKFRNDVVAAGHGFVIASLFVLLLLTQGAAALGWLTHAAGDVAGGTAAMIGGGLGAASQSGAVRDMVEDSLGDMNIKEAQVVIPGVTARLLRGDNEGAKNYLARQTGKTPQEVDQKITQLRAQLDQALVKAREATATAMKATGWSLFVLTVLSAVAAGMGGLWASMVNARKPLAETEEETGLYPSAGLKI